MTEVPNVLAGGGAPATYEDLLDRLSDLGIEVQTIEHQPVFTVDEAKAHRGKLEGAHTKNLFLRDKKKRMWLVVCREDRSVDLKKLPAVIRSGRLSFGSAQRLMENLGVIPGAVTPFAVINDHGLNVQVAIERGLLDDTAWNFHPLDNARTTSIQPQDMLRFLEALEHTPQLVDLGSATR
ncbi:MAG TPA: prolyl-tRNA synthetase associated domain-containing protein [Acidobacteriota bacterium]|nr:prolyl-tRNA synthetase associated domain-containing protein [Acidobacteriota bacterium]